MSQPTLGGTSSSLYNSYGRLCGTGLRNSKQLLSHGQFTARAGHCTAAFRSGCWGSLPQLSPPTAGHWRFRASHPEGRHPISGSSRGSFQANNSYEFLAPYGVAFTRLSFCLETTGTTCAVQTRRRVPFKSSHQECQFRRVASLASTLGSHHQAWKFLKVGKTHFSQKPDTLKKK